MGEKTDQFKKYILERTKPGQEAAMEQVIDDVLAKRAEGKMDTFYLMTVAPKAFGMIKPEAMGDVRAKLNELRKQA